MPCCGTLPGPANQTKFCGRARFLNTTSTVLHIYHCTSLNIRVHFPNRYLYVAHFICEKYSKPMSRSTATVSQTVILLHRDLSVYNLMYEVGNVIIFGILNDYDLSVILKDDKVLPAASSKHRTGTAPFMAHELLNTRRSVEHLYRHELESFLYIMVWTAVVYRGRARPEGKKKPLMQWFVGDWLSISEEKFLFFISRDKSERIMGEITEKYKVMRYTIRQLYLILKSAFCRASILVTQAEVWQRAVL